MSGHRYRPAEYALQRIVESFSNQLSQLEETHLTHTHRVDLRFCELENIDHLVLRYLNTGALSFEEASEDWLINDKAWSSSIWGKATGDLSIWQLLQREGKRLRFGMKWGEKEKSR